MPERPPAARPGALMSAVERAARASGRRTPSDGAVAEDVRTARAALSTWLTAGREARGWSRDHVARVTRIPMRTLENLEDGRWNELPADVFVRGFLRGYARCVGLSVDDALAQYSGCGFAAAPVASAQARALIDSMAPLAPSAAMPRAATSTPITSQPRILTPAPSDSAVTRAAVAIALPEVAVEALAPKRRHSDPPKRRAPTVSGSAERDARGRFVRKSMQMAAVTPPDEPITAPAPELDASMSGEVEIEIVADAIEAAPIEVAAVPVVAAPVRVVPPPAVRISATRRAVMAAPRLVIDDDDPDDADRAREQRALQQKDGGWRSFLPPALLDQERGGRQGGLTLAVIILLIVATLTLSYLMRRPSSTGEGVTVLPPQHLVA